MVDMRKRFRGNQPISVSSELEGDGFLNVGGQRIEGVKKPKQLYAGKPAFETPFDEKQKGMENGLGFDPDKTRGL
jgi:cytochrome c oxidase assembly factor 5